MRAGMKKISSGATFFHKRIFPLIWFGGLVFILTRIWTDAALQQENWMFLVLPGFMIVIGIVVMKKLVWDLADEVYDGGEYLLVKNRGEEERIPLSNIMNVSASTSQNPPRITLRLVRGGRFGTEVSFCPVTKFSFNPFAKNPLVDELIRRVDQARLKRAV